MHHLRVARLHDWISVVAVFMCVHRNVKYSDKEECMQKKLHREFSKPLFTCCAASTLNHTQCFVPIEES